jgi:hypothetical protein
LQSTGVFQDLAKAKSDTTHAQSFDVAWSLFAFLLENLCSKYSWNLTTEYTVIATMLIMPFQFRTWSINLVQSVSCEAHGCQFLVLQISQVYTPHNSQDTTQ